MRVEALDTFAGDFGADTEMVRYRKGTRFEVPDPIGDLWTQRGLVKPVETTTKPPKR